MKRIGLLGGTFNPVHYGHLAMAEIVKEQLKLDKVIFIPSYLPPHKSGAGVISAGHRLKMVKLAIGGNPGFEVSDVEIRREGKSYSIDTVRYFRDRFAPDKLFFLIGGDMVSGLTKWKDFDVLRKMIAFVAVNRPGYRKVRHSIRHIPVVMPDIAISSSALRYRISKDKTVRYLVPEAVIKYIQRHQLYKT